MEFKKYQHIENNFDKRECLGLLGGVITVQPKLDGTNCQMYMQDSELIITSRNKILSVNDDNANCYKSLIQIDKYRQFFNDYPYVKLCGEWLIKNKTNYISEAYDKFYVFDGILLYSEEDNGVCDYWRYDKLATVLTRYSIEYVPYLEFDSINDELLIKNLIDNKINMAFKNYLVKNSEKWLGEGLVFKNYDYKNPFGISKWCKYINKEFYYDKTNFLKEVKDITLENNFVVNNIGHILEKCLLKIDSIDNSNIGNYVKLVLKEFFDDIEIDDKLDIRAINKVINQLSVSYFKKELIRLKDIEYNEFDNIVGLARNSAEQEMDDVFKSYRKMTQICLDIRLGQILDDLLIIKDQYLMILDMLSLYMSDRNGYLMRYPDAVEVATDMDRYV